MTVELEPSEVKLESLCYNVKQVAVVLGISLRVASNLVHSEGFPAFRLGRRVLVKRDRLREWVDNQPEGLGDRYVRKGM